MSGPSGRLREGRPGSSIEIAVKSSNCRKRKPGDRQEQPQSLSHQKRLRKSGDFLKRMESTVTTLLSRNLDDPPSHKDYMDLYSDVYENLVDGSVRLKSRSGRSSYEATSQVGDFNGYGCTAEQIFAKLDSILKKKMRQLTNEGNELDRSDILQFYADKFLLFQSHANFIHGIFSYMNRQWVKSINQNALGQSDTIYSFAMAQWRNSVFKEFNSQVAEALFNLIQEYRNGLTAQEDIIKTVLDSYVILSDGKNGPKTGTWAVKDLSLYRDKLERAFLDRSKRFYGEIADSWVSGKRVEDFVEEVKELVKSESKLAETLFHPSTLPNLVAVLLHEFVREKSGFLLSALPRFLEDDDLRTLKSVYQLLTSLTDFSLVPAIEVFRNVMTESGLQAVGQVHEAILGKEIEGRQIPIRYVDALVSVCKKYDGIILTCFNNNVEFRKAFDEAAVIFVNQNVQTKAGADQFNFNKTPELLGRYSNVILTSNSSNVHEEFSESLEKMFLTLKFVESKDSFERYYNWNLLNRLVNKTSCNEDHEAAVISQMKTTFGQDFSIKSFQLTHDARLSQETSRNFKMALQEANQSFSWDFHICIFKSGSCKLPESVPFNMPHELTQAMDRFSEFYGRKYEGRILTWYHNKSHGEIIFYAGANMKKKYTFVTSIYQMTTLLLFNDRHSLTFQQIKDSTLIHPSILKQVLGILERTKLLVRNSGGAYEVYGGYKSHKVKHDINVPVKTEGRTGGEEAVNEEVQNTRKFLLQAVMVRLMKANQTMRHSDLIVQTISAASARFKPNIAQIKRTIDCLIEKEYFKRDEKETDRYIYVS